MGVAPPRRRCHEQAPEPQRLPGRPAAAQAAAHAAARLKRPLGPAARLRERLVRAFCQVGQQAGGQRCAVHCISGTASSVGRQRGAQRGQCGGGLRGAGRGRVRVERHGAGAQCMARIAQPQDSKRSRSGKVGRIPARPPSSVSGTRKQCPGSHAPAQVQRTVHQPPAVPAQAPPRAAAPHSLAPPGSAAGGRGRGRGVSGGNACTHAGHVSVPSMGECCHTVAGRVLAIQRKKRSVPSHPHTPAAHPAERQRPRPPACPTGAPPPPAAVRAAVRGLCRGQCGRAEAGHSRRCDKLLACLPTQQTANGSLGPRYSTALSDEPPFPASGVRTC